MDVDHLVGELGSWQKAKRHLATLSLLPVEEKRRRVYPRVIELTARLLTGVKDTGYALKTYTEFLAKELSEEPELAAALYAAMHGPLIYDRGDNDTELYFFTFVSRARDPRAVDVLRATRSSARWEEAVLAIDGASLSDELLARTVKGELVATATGFYCGARAREPLHALFETEYRRDLIAFGLASIAHEEDAPWFEALDRSAAFAQAKRLYAALAADKPKKRLAALDTIRRTIRDAHTPNAILVGLCRLLGDPEPAVVERAALALAEHSRLGSKASIVHHAIFLRMAPLALANGVTQPAREALDAVKRTIPRSEALPAGRTVSAPTPPPPKKKKKSTKSATKRAPSARRPARLLLRGGVLTHASGVYLLAKAWGYDEDDVRILFGVPEKGRLALREITEPLDVCALLATRGRWSERADAFALGIDGEALLMKGALVSREPVAGPKRRGDPFVGHMRQVAERDDGLYALGYGGQAYLRELDGPWRPLHETRPSAPGYRICFLDVAVDGSEHVLAGTAVSELELSDEIRASKAAGDFRAYAAAIRAATRPNRAALFRLSSDWEEIPVEGSATSVFAITSSAGAHHLWLDTREVLSTSDFRAFHAAPALGGVKVDALVETDDAVLVASDGRLFVFDGAHLRDHEPPMPTMRSPLVSLSAASEQLLLCTEKEVWLLQGDAWRELSLRTE